MLDIFAFFFSIISLAYSTHMAAPLADRIDVAKITVVSITLF
jgi:hypothetical protein